MYLSDVFENNQVAQGAARVTAEVLERGRSCVWVFAQSDRAQRDVFLSEVQRLLVSPDLAWRSSSQDARGGAAVASLQYYDKLWLCDIEETSVFYG